MQQDVDDPWPLEVIGHDGKAVNVTMEPGDMVMYESHSVLHGRPFPLKGRFMANIFIVRINDCLPVVDCMVNYVARSLIFR
jgi:hypothetical protein